MLLLSEGHLVYHGPREQIEEFFAELVSPRPSRPSSTSHAFRDAFRRCMLFSSGQADAVGSSLHLWH